MAEISTLSSLHYLADEKVSTGKSNFIVVIQAVNLAAKDCLPDLSHARFSRIREFSVIFLL